MVKEPTKREGTKFTEKMLARAAAGKRLVMVYDARCPGLGAKVGQGRVSLFLRYGPRGARRFLTLGRLSADFSLEAGRKLATEMLGQVARGKDPVLERATATARAVLFPAWAAVYLARTDRLRKMKKPPRAYIAIAAKKWARRGLGTITKSDVLTLREEVVEEAAANVRARRELARKAKRGKKAEDAIVALDGHASGNRWLAHVGAAFAAAVEEGLITRSPALGIRALPEAAPRARVLSDDEMAALIGALEDEDAFTAAVFHVLIETGARVSEVLRARWADLDLDADGATWRLPSPKSGHVEVVPLARCTAERLEKLPRVGEWLIPAKNNPTNHRGSVAEDWARLKLKAGLGADVHVHDIRRTFGLAVARGAGLHMASKLLRHADIRITQTTYAPLDLNLQREATEARAKLLYYPKKATK